MAIQDHAKLQKATHGREMRQEKHEFHSRNFFVCLVTYFARFGTNFVTSVTVPNNKASFRTFERCSRSKTFCNQYHDNK